MHAMRPCALRWPAPGLAHCRKPAARLRPQPVIGCAPADVPSANAMDGTSIGSNPEPLPH